jgi:hypothetical protein
MVRITYILLLIINLSSKHGLTWVGLGLYGLNVVPILVHTIVTS